MKLKKLTLLSILLILSLLATSQDGFVIKGKLTGLLDNTNLYLVRNHPGGKGLDTIGFSIARNMQFVFRGKVPVEAEAYFIKFQQDTVKYASFFEKVNLTRKVIPKIEIILENKFVTLEGSLEELLTKKATQCIKITGLPSHDEWVTYHNEIIKLEVEANLLNRKIWEDFAVDKDIEKLNKKQKANTTLNDFKDKWIKTHTNSLFTPYLILNRRGKDINWLKSQYSKLSIRARNSKYGQDLSKQIQTEQQLEGGTHAPDFSLRTSEGEILSLYNIANSNKLTLIDFWASWCGPCKAEFKDLKQLYIQYGNKGFSIIGVSTDNKKEKWEKAVAENQLPWYNVWTGENKNVKNLYNIERLPTTFLLDKDGKILAKDISKEELIKLLKSL